MGRVLKLEASLNIIDKLRGMGNKCTKNTVFFSKNTFLFISRYCLILRILKTYTLVISTSCTFSITFLFKKSQHFSVN